MRKIILVLSLISIVIGCGRSPRKTSVLVPEPHSDKRLEEEERAVSFNILALREGDWDLHWMTWQLSCLENKFQGVKVEKAVIEFPEESIGSEACRLQASGSVPEELKNEYVTEDGIFYAAKVSTVKAGRQSVEAAIKYEKHDNKEPTSDDLVASTKAGEKCADFDTETFECN